MDAEADLIAHRAGRHVNGRFLSQHVGDTFFKPPNSWIVAEDVVAHVGGRHSGAHAGRGARDSIAAEVDQQFHFGFSFALFLARMDGTEALSRLMRMLTSLK